MGNVKNGTKIKLKGGQKHKIGHIEDNYKVSVYQLHQYVVHVDRRQRKQDLYHCYLLVWLYGMKNVKMEQKSSVRGVKNTKSVTLKTIMK